MCNLKVILYTVHPAAKELVIMEPTVVKHTRQLNQSYMGTSARYQPNTSAQLAKCLQTISKNLALSQSEIPTHHNTDTESHLIVVFISQASQFCTPLNSCVFQDPRGLVRQ